ncbi:MAG TPA: hypothetical protein VK746_00115 [Candidatus Eisenbacteria bacterium]|jgi:hypothetical protein|nr:hypothetical protein [Candidatus Eisenbacteria bacterium]
MTTRKILLGLLLAAGAAGLFSACSTMPQGPTYTDAELKAICERRGGWWRGELIAGFCEFQSASLAP